MRCTHEIHTSHSHPDIYTRAHASFSRRPFRRVVQPTAFPHALSPAIPYVSFPGTPCHGWCSPHRSRLLPIHPQPITRPEGSSTQHHMPMTRDLITIIRDLITIIRLSHRFCHVFLVLRGESIKTSSSISMPCTLFVGRQTILVRAAYPPPYLVLGFSCRKKCFHEEAIVFP